MRVCTLMFLTKRQGGAVSHICLALKKKGFGTGKFNGVGGKVERHETIEEAAAREALEEIGIKARHFSKKGELTFFFLNNPDWDQKVHVYVCTVWEGEPIESEEMAPQWYHINDIPYENMWADDSYWLPHILEGRSVKAEFTFRDVDQIHKKDVQLVDSLI